MAPDDGTRRGPAERGMARRIRPLYRIGMPDSLLLRLLLGGLVLAHLAGLVTAVVALMSPRTSQGSVAWVLSLVFAPWLAVPLFWMLGRARFEGYDVAREEDDPRFAEVLRRSASDVAAYRSSLPEPVGALMALERLAHLPILEGNETQLLVDGQETFESIFQGMERARRHLLVQFYIVRDDDLGQAFKEALIRCARRGVHVCFLVDRVGSHALPDRYLDELRAEGVEAEYFSTLRRRPARLQVNFRNHRKIVVVDGEEAWTGGFNVGDEYLGKDPQVGPWRDTHLRVRGPAAIAFQMTFLKDWFWATRRPLELEWTPASALPEGSGEPVLVIPSGPSDPVETASLFVQHAINSATRRVWIASPYFVPDQGVQEALKLAVFRGVDVRILVPKRGDSTIIDLAGFAFYEDLLRTGVRIFRFREGFLHCKTMVVDDGAAAVGTVNLDNRSLRLNFEITALLFGADSVAELARQFEGDLAVSVELAVADVTNRSFPARLASQVVYLFAPVL